MLPVELFWAGMFAAFGRTLAKLERLCAAVRCAYIVGMTHYTRADLDMADRHIAEGECHIAQQEGIVTRLRALSLPAESAEKLLGLYNSIMVEHRIHRAAIADALDIRRTASVDWHDICGWQLPTQPCRVDRAECHDLRPF